LFRRLLGLVRLGEDLQAVIEALHLFLGDGDGCGGEENGEQAKQPEEADANDLGVSVKPCPPQRLEDLWEDF